MKNQRKFNTGLFALILGFAIVVGMSAFQPKQSTQYWFQVDTSDGTILSYQGNEPPGGDCTSTSLARPVCSVAFDEADISDPMNPAPPISDVDNDPSNQIDELKRLEE